MSTEIKAEEGQPVATVTKKTRKQTSKPAAKNTSKFAHGQREDGSFKIEAPDIAQIEHTHGKKEYWCGVTKDCPIQTVHVAGIEFPRWSKMPNVNDRVTDDGEPEFIGGSPEIGTFVKLTDGKVAEVIKRIQRRVVRQIGGKGGHALIMNLDAQRYVPNLDTDTPLGEFLFLIPAERVTARMAQSFPQPLITKE